jgi:hypothetical protein
MQDMLATKLVEKETRQFQTGKMSQSQYQNALAGRWASIGMAGTDVSKYGQRVGTTGADLATVLPGVKSAGQSSTGEGNYNVAVTINAQTTDPQKIADAATVGVKKSIQDLRNEHRNKVIRQRVQAPA